MKNICAMEVISPFGFEPLEDKTFLSKNIRRYYCYLGIKQNEPMPPSMIASVFRKKLFEILATFDKKVLDHFILIIEQDHFIQLKNEGYECQAHDKAIDIQCRYVTHGILDDYANYIIGSLDSLLKKKSDCADFIYNKRHRNRIYQLYLMLETLFNHLTPSFSDKEKDIYKRIPRLVNNRIDIFFNEKLLAEPATPEESCIYYDLITPRILMIEKVIKNKNENENMRLTCGAYHIQGDLEVTIDKNVYEEAKSKIIRTYLQFV
ncbi:MAG TPA: hypothetical protein VLJ15_06935 [Gammaproteobacteria bacterium]|nr:hypothetical protein [Gammaproteobacteria bacterium]